MKTKLYQKSLKSLLILAAFLPFLHLQAQTLTVLSPNGGEVWVTETTQTVTWTNSGDAIDIMIEYSVDSSGYWYYLGYVPSYDSSNSFSFYNYMAATTTAKIRVSDYSDPANADESDNFFTVKESPVYFYTPYYGDSYYRTSIVTLEWYSATLDSFNLDYSTDNGATWTAITSNYTGYDYDWTVPDLLSDECFIRITDPADATNFGISTMFSIVELPTLTLVSPNGGETWTYGENPEISWIGTNLPYYVYLEISLDGGTSWDYLGYGYGADTGGSVTAFVPYESSTNAYVRVSDPNASESVFDISDGPFTVYVPPVIVYYPNEGQEFYNGSETTVSWIADGIDSLKIELTTDNGQTWSVVEESIDANYWGYYWTVQGTPSQTCQLRLSDATDPSTYGLSGTFIILETPVITLISPAAGDIWNTNSTQTIAWVYDNPNTNYVFLEYSVDSGQHWNYIGYAEHEGTQGSTEWQTPDIESYQYLMRIRDYALHFVNDTSETFGVITFPETPICMVTVDSATNQNVIVWEKPASTLIDQFIIYKESSQANVYEPIGTVNYNDLSVFADVNSNPLIKSYRYKLGFSNADGHVFPMSNLHQTIHLSINQGVGNSWNLIWTGYQGFDVATYNIYRSSDGSTFEQIASVSSSFSSYTDFGATAGDVFYIIEVVNPNGCNPGSRADDYSVVRSNIASSRFQGVDDDDLLAGTSVYPNPATERVNVVVDRDLNGDVIFEMTDLLGRKVITEPVSRLRTGQITVLNTAELREGIYLLTIRTEDASHTRRLVIRN